jgi:hypothetical protein
MAYTTINKPASYFNTIIYTGNGVSPRSLTGVGFQPDLTLIKNRDQAGSNGLYDIIRGVGSTKSLSTDSTDQQPGGDGAGYGYLSAFNADGFSVTTGSVAYNIVNQSSINYVDYNWLGSNTTTTNTNGSITSTISVNTTSGFSVVKYTGTGSLATVGHGLGVAPAMIIVKRYDGGNGGQWNVYHQSLGNTKVAYLNSNVNPDTTATRWNNTSPTSSVFTVNTSGDVNNSGSNQIAYCFAEIKGYSKFSSWISNGSATADAFIYTGFKPAFVLMKMSTSTSAWFIWDNKRGTYNPDAPYWTPNTNGAEGTNVSADFYSNGFRSNGLFNSYSGQTIIYAAFAENPFVSSTSIPTTAR